MVKWRISQEAQTTKTGVPAAATRARKMDTRSGSQDSYTQKLPKMTEDATLGARQQVYKPAGVCHIMQDKFRKDKPETTEIGPQQGAVGKAWRGGRSSR